MPELPEVEVVRVGLEPAVTGATVSSIVVFDPRSLRRHPGPEEDFVDRLVGRTIAGAVRRGKFIWLPLDGGEALVMHLGMSGQVLLRDLETDDALTRVRLELEHPRLGPVRINFADQRIFGSLSINELVPTADGLPGGLGSPEALIPEQVAHIARDPLDPALDERGLLGRLARRHSGIKRALLDQTLVSGVGNIYADEALWAARVHYDHRASALSRPRARNLLAEVRLVLQRALDEGGTSFDSQYVNVNGASGYFSHSLNAYGRHGHPCPRCRTNIVREQFMNRGSHFCPRCQRRPRDA